MKRQKGFTLIELLVVIAIIGLLATIAAVALNNARTSSRDTKRLADVKQIQTGLELYFNALNTYPYHSSATTCGTTNELVSAIDTACTTGDANGFDIKDYLGGIDNIKDPSGTGACADSGQTAVCDYSYEDNGTDGTTYKIHFYLEGSAGGFVKGGLTATPSGITQP